MVVTEVVDPGHLWIQTLKNATDIEQLGERLNAQLTASPPVAGAFTPKVGEVSAAKFSEDDQWYRAKIVKLTDKSANVLFIDYGNVCKNKTPTVIF